MRSFIKYNWPILIIFLLGMASLGWFSDGLLIAGGDNTIYLNPAFHIKSYLYSWLDYIDAGNPNTIKAIIFPFSAFWYFLGLANLSLVNIERLWVFLHFAIPGISMYFLVKHLYRSSPGKGNIAATLGASVYMFNYLVMLDVIQLAIKPLLAFFPLLFLFWMKGLEEKKVSFKYSSLFALTSLIYSSANINIAYIAPVYLILFIYFIYYLFSSKRFINSFLFLLLTSLLFILANLWWLGDSLVSIIRASGSVLQVMASYHFLKSTPIYETYRFMGFWAFRISGHIPYSPHYYQFPLLITTYLIPMFAFFSLVFNKRRKIKIFFSIIGLLGLFLSKGINFPFGGIYQFLFDKLPFFGVFREPYTKFTIIQIFAIAILFGFFSEDLYFYLKKKITNSKAKTLHIAKIVIILLLIIVLGSYYPLLNGIFIQNKDWYKNTVYSLYVKVPDYWLEAGKWFKETLDKDSRVLLMPKNYYGQSYNWSSGITVGDPAASYFLTNSLIRKPNTSLSSKDRLMEQIYKSIKNDSNFDLKPFFDLFSIKYVLQQNDVSMSADLEVLDPVSMKKILNGQKSLSLINKFGNIDSYADKEKKQYVGSFPALELYKVIEQNDSKPIFQAEKVIYINQDVEAFPRVFSFIKSNPNNLYIISSDIKESDVNQIKYIDEMLLNLDAKKLATSDLDVTNYDFDVYKEGNYQLLANKCLYEDITTKQASNIVIEVNGMSIISRLPPTGDWSFVDLGRLPVGHYSISMTVSPRIINQAVCKNNLWLKGNDFVDKTPYTNDSLLASTKINPSKYLVNIKNFQSLVLVFNQSFDNNWKIYHNGKELKWKHFMANGYANGWVIDDTNGKLLEDYNFTIEFEPQKIAYYCSVISLLSIFVLLIFVLLNFLKKNPKQKLIIFFSFIYFSFVLIQFLNLTIDRDKIVFAILTLWLLISYLDKNVSKASLPLSIGFLLLCPFLLLNNQVNTAKQSAILSFIYLSSTIVMQFISLFIRQADDKNDKIK